MFRNLIHQWHEAVRDEQIKAVKKSHVDGFLLCLQEGHDPTALFDRVLDDITISQKSLYAADFEHLVHWFTMNASSVVKKHDTYLREVTVAAKRAASLLPHDQQENFKHYVLNRICGNVEDTKLSLRVFSERLVAVLRFAGCENYDDEDYNLRQTGPGGAFLLVLKKALQDGNPMTFDGQYVQPLVVTPPSFSPAS